VNFVQESDINKDSISLPPQDRRSHTYW